MFCYSVVINQTKEVKMKTYLNPPDDCDLCKHLIDDCFYDGKTCIGPFANMCQECFDNCGTKIYTKYEYDGKNFIKSKGE